MKSSTLNWKAYVAECIGAGTLTCAVLTGISANSMMIPLVAGIVLGLFVYTIGGISGAHINPAVTVGLWSVKKIDSVQAVWYIIAQLVGAALAMYAHSLY